MLYDANWNQLDSRFLKNDENVRTGELLVFDTHLVDIGEPEEDHTSVLVSPLALNSFQLMRACIFSSTFCFGEKKSLLYFPMFVNLFFLVLQDRNWDVRIV